MMPNLDPKKMGKMMQRMGISMDEIDAEEVVISLKDGGSIVINNPQVVKMKMQGKDSFQISGDVSEGGDDSDDGEVDEGDVEMVMSQTGASKEDAVTALQEAGGDIAKAILDLGSVDTIGE